MSASSAIKLVQDNTDLDDVVLSASTPDPDEDEDDAEDDADAPLEDEPGDDDE